MLRFFFSSRRRHTSLQGDWSSDVCSSDLFRERDAEPGVGRAAVVVADEEAADAAERVEIGRASCRERVWIWGVAGGLKEKWEWCGRGMEMKRSSHRRANTGRRSATTRCFC